ncbi:hypothetical protein WN51_14613 [Melipona quadrifasciata]|uniref:Uncharacterized protein n=1 Tax=Melipona quadrifasciata TaxID=166423 RepID=A0A0M8ZZ95_9HYME|nr:hypothetical protein WN51_14613 [Melipona quadrifasciata]
MQSSDFFIQLLRQHMNSNWIRPRFGPQFYLRQYLICKRVAHYKTGMSCGASKIN